MTNMSTTKHIDASIAQRSLEAIRKEGELEGRLRGPALYPQAYIRDLAKCEAWLDGYFKGMKMPKEVTP